MTRERYEQIKAKVNSYNWKIYALNLKAIIKSVRDSEKLTKEDLLYFKAYQYIDARNKQERGFLTDCAICNGRGFNHSFNINNDKIEFTMTKCMCSANNYEED